MKRPRDGEHWLKFKRVRLLFMRCPVRISADTLTTLRSFCGIPQSLQGNAWKAPYNTPWPLPLTSLHIHSLPSSYNSTQCKQISVTESVIKYHKTMSKYHHPALESNAGIPNTKKTPHISSSQSEAHFPLLRSFHGITTRPSSFVEF